MLELTFVARHVYGVISQRNRSLMLYLGAVIASLNASSLVVASNAGHVSCGASLSSSVASVLMPKSTS